jgi:AcrR family transcriptional regulator
MTELWGPRGRRDVSYCHHISTRCQSLSSRTSVADAITIGLGMARWKPDSRGRLYEAALELYGKRGFEKTTVAQIAERAGLTERTFFRHFPDKREVLFGRSGAMEEELMNAIANAPASLAPIDAVAVGLAAAATQLPDRETARRRQTIIAATPELQERELSKFATLSAALAEALKARGLEHPAATLTAEVAIAVFRTAFARWIDDSNDRDLPELIRESLDGLNALAARGSQAPVA